MDIQRAGQDVGVDLAGVAKLLADGTRAAFCLALLDGRAWTANELARYAGIAPSTATSHLNLLVNGGLLVEERHGRHRYVRVTDRRVVELIESLAALAHSAVSAHVHWRPPADNSHLAGTVALAITDAMVERELLEWGPEPGLTGKGARWLAETGITVPTGSRRSPVRSCLDWTERRPHLAGTVGAALCTHALTTGWMTRIGTTRALLVTPAGRKAWHDHLGLPPAGL
ncbi:ArsR/SmtB family transcription factor [Streptomyces tendae]|uniref:ArsR/SmtB family transcription factor n=1 Tax=Streptomyces tendae TaxID=1932 RepID=UPI003668BA58